ncbi:hypothetical protein Q1695_008345 [Nippostrongylus brasiliensis]|nr:hypothetical protein Q1695_008345 [Nippostrongylus brasiliensis]
MNDLDAERATTQQGVPVPLFVGATTIMAPQHQLEQDIYDCNLEEMATATASGCPTVVPGLARAFNMASLDKGKTIVDAVDSWEQLLSQNKVQWPKKNILPDTAVPYYPYATMVNSNATAVGCGKMECTYNGLDKAIIACVFDVPALAKDSEIYATGQPCSDCTVYTPSTCDGSLCVRTQPTTAAPTTEAPTTEAPTTEAPTTAAPTTTAGGSGGTGGSTNCSVEQSDQLRQRVVDMINYRRDQLAQGKIAKNNGALLPTAANMLKITYNCTLEVEALTFAKTCSAAGSNLLGKSENFYRTSGSDMVQAAAVADREKALKDFNEVRSTVASGDAESQSGAIPSAGNMYKLVYDCDLEQMAMVLASGCPGKAPNLKRAITFSRFNDDAKTIEDAIKEGTDTFFTKQVKWPKKNILPDVTVDYYPFVTMVNANATAVGCYKEACDNSGAGAGTTVVCFYDVPPLEKSSQIYVTGEPCKGCTVYSPSTCDKDGLLCVRTENETQTTAAAATSATGTGSCSPEQNDQMRQKVLDMINYRRSRLAGGNIAKANGNHYPSAANMQKLKYDCSLEVQARNYAKQCTNTGIGDIQIENFAQISSVQTDLDAIDQAIRYWWKQGTMADGIGVQQVMFKDKHKNSTVRFFTLLGWATMERIGCGVFKCNNVFNVACRFTPGGNYFNTVVYLKGAPASQCSAGTRADATFPELCA